MRLARRTCMNYIELVAVFQAIFQGIGLVEFEGVSRHGAIIHSHNLKSRAVIAHGSPASATKKV